jgi:hypothetical protein
VLVRYAVLGCLPLLACSGDDTDSTDTTGDGPGFSTTYAMFSECTGCHGGYPIQGELDLSTEDIAFSQLVDVPAAGIHCADPPHVRVVPGDVDGSLLYQKLSMTMDCGLGMPESEGPFHPGANDVTPFTAEQLAIVAAWIDGGAVR